MCPRDASRRPSSFSSSLSSSSTLRWYRHRTTVPSSPSSHSFDKADPPNKPDRRENIFTIPNALSLGRLAISPFLGYFVVTGQYPTALAAFAVASVTDLVDGAIARRFHQQTKLGTILDPFADKMLMLTVTVTLAYQHLLPLALVAIILFKDFALILAAFYIRWATLHPPKTWARYWDIQLPSVEIRPTAISKANTALQVVLMGLTLLFEAFPMPIAPSILHPMWYLVGATTIVSGSGYLFNQKDTVIAIQPLKNQMLKRRKRSP